MRATARLARGGCDPAWGEALAAHVLAELPPSPGAIVAGFWPLAGEIDIRPLLEALYRHGHVIVLPVTAPRGEPLTFREWQPGSEMVAERFGTVRPVGPEHRPDWLFIPLLAFDRAGRRLGYGGGYYDRTLSGLPGSRRIGCAFAAQEVAEVPTGPTDVRMHAIATERGVIECPAAD